MADRFYGTAFNGTLTLFHGIEILEAMSGYWVGAAIWSCSRLKILFWGIFQRMPDLGHYGDFMTAALDILLIKPFAKRVPSFLYSFPHSHNWRGGNC